MPETSTLLSTERTELLRRYRKLLRTCRPIMEPGDDRRIRTAFEMAVKAHQNDRRKSGEAYIFHPVAVAQIVAEEIGLGTTSVICALLHDVVEDTDITLKDIALDFGDTAAKIIDGLTKIKGFSREDLHNSNSSEQIENFRKMILTLSDDVRVILVKLADRLHNMRTMDSMASHKQLKIASETQFLYAPLAHRLGLYNIKSELEDLSMKYLNADTYRQIANKLNNTKAKRNKFIKDFIKPIEDKLSESAYANKCEIKGRPKAIASIYNKMVQQSIDFEQVYDLFAIRIILDVPLEEEKLACWQVYSLITDLYKPSTNRMRDWIAEPRANGYESLHITVMSQSGKWVEVQIRTQRMDEVAEKGLAAHWRYKGQKNDSGIDDWLLKIREILENHGSNSLELLNDFKLNLSSEEVFVYTPKGDLKKLPKGATALDFAFEIHTAVGMRCIGAKVNHKIVPLNHPLKSGDQLEVLTSNTQKPKQDWLKFVVTSKAKANIRNALNDDRRLLADNGRETLMRKLKNWKLDASEEKIHNVCNALKYKNPLDFFVDIAEENINMAEVKDLMTAADRPTRPENTEREKIDTTRINKNTATPDDILIIDSQLSHVVYNFAKCCNPIPDDKIFGFVTVQDGIKIHRTDCTNAPELLAKYGYRIQRVRWKETANNASAFATGLRITGIDDMGIISNISRVITDEMHVNMRNISIDSNDGVFEGNISLYVKDNGQLLRIIEKLMKVKGVVNVKRYDQ
jgi:GTP pyrophosphokinase